MGLVSLALAKPCYHAAYSNYPATDYSFIAYGPPFNPPFGYNDYNKYASPVAAVQVHQAANQYHYTVITCKFLFKIKIHFKKLNPG